MAEIIEPGVLHHKPRRKLKALDVIIFVVILAVLVALGIKLADSLRLKNEVAAAQTVSDQVVADIASKNGAAAQKLGDQNFQAKNSVAHLNQVFTFIAGNVKGSPTIINKTVDKSTKPDTVYIIYKYSGKTPYYIRVGSAKTGGVWHLTSISGNDNESKLVVKH